MLNSTHRDQTIVNQFISTFVVVVVAAVVVTVVVVVVVVFLLGSGQTEVYYRHCFGSILYCLFFFFY